MNDTTPLFLEGDSDSARVAGSEGGEQGGVEGEGGGWGGQIKGREWAVEKSKAKQN